MIAGRTPSEIAHSIRVAVEGGQLARGEALPTVRGLAEQLGVNRNTVAVAYRHLAAAGLLEGRGRQGSRIAPATGAPLARRAAARDLSGGNPDLALLPDLNAVLKTLAWQPRAYEDAPDDPELMAHFRDEFGRDGLPAGDLWLASGTFDAVGLILRKMVPSSAPLGVEDPCFMTTLGFARQAGYPVLPMAVDEEGVTPEGLARALEAGARAVILTPRAQNPLGGFWSPARRAALGDVLRAHPDVLLLEDDHFAPLSVAPAMTLVAPDRPHWAIIRSVSKVAGPDLRLAVVSSSRAVRRACLPLAACSARWVSSILQGCVKAVLTVPGHAQQVARARASYARRREAARAALAAEGIEARGRDGMNLWIPVADEDAVTRRLLDAGWTARPGAAFRLAAPPAIRITTSALEDDEAVAFARALAAILRDEVVVRGA
ncbi:aminotransferase class I/II-fold pyridoxal phosphate-dependent enzyme [Aquabacter sp. L1I39]|uniref:aminotransferase class I/II-fold pyridoxal phosphate-dependent enzyme n=1 Tax=Aquabacter sp. L1I39 TaxID=2820278 RepID=UPI001ADCCCFE|nr:aminotransferase class I/II-fold pyridoxal phosphate-dependent enzyme [Aquabacter sp. L1I39]QTL05035.1 aminotransferase class I/II-fold pyridoxal phosphate-dependent enzyme [Aquabacter sp. L1I39]